MKVVGYIYNKKVWPEGNGPKGSNRHRYSLRGWKTLNEPIGPLVRCGKSDRSPGEKRDRAGERESERESRALSEPSPAISGGDPETRPDRPRKVHKAGPRPSQTFCGTFSGSEVPSSSTYTTTRGGPENRPDRPRKAQKADPRNKASQTFCGTFPGTKVNPWTHPQILRPAGVRNLDLSAPKSAKSGPPQQSLADVLRNLLRNQSEPLDSSTDTTTRGGPEFGPFSPEKLKKRTPATKPPRRSAEPSPEPKWTPGLIHRYYDPRG